VKAINNSRSWLDRKYILDGNRYYRNITKDEIPKYLEWRTKRKDGKIIARFDCGNETKAREYWKVEGENKVQIMWKGSRGPETRNRRIRDNRRTKRHGENIEWDGRRIDGIEGNNREEKSKGETRRGGVKRG
jgi:hypothetical protein